MADIKSMNLGDYSVSKRSWQGIPSIDTDGRGTFLASWYSGGTGEGCMNYAAAYISRDGGRTFTGPVAVVDPPGYTRAYDPAVFTSPDGRINWFWAESEGMYDGVCGVWRSVWNGSGFSKAKRICNGIMINKPIISNEGKWLVPAAIWNMKPYFGKEDNTLVYSDYEQPGCHIYESSDGGLTFLQVGCAKNNAPSPDEHMVIELKDGSFWMLVRTNYGIGESFSYDGCRNWTELRPSSIPSPVSRFFIRRMPSGRILLLNHATAGTGNRDNLTAFLSEDEGKTWPYSLLLDERDKVSYPDAAIEGDRITLIYDRDRYGAGEILTACLTEDEILSGRLRSADSYIKNVISSIGRVLG